MQELLAGEVDSLWPRRIEKGVHPAIPLYFLHKLGSLEEIGRTKDLRCFRLPFFDLLLELGFNLLPIDADFFQLRRSSETGLGETSREEGEGLLGFC